MIWNCEVCNCRISSFQFNKRYAEFVSTDGCVHDMTLRHLSSTLYGQCCRRHVVGQPVASDISVLRSR